MGSVASDELLGPIKGWIRRRSKTESRNSAVALRENFWNTHREQSPKSGGWNTLHFTNVFVRVTGVSSKWQCKEVKICPK